MNTADTKKRDRLCSHWSMRRFNRVTVHNLLSLAFTIFQHLENGTIGRPWPSGDSLSWTGLLLRGRRVSSGRRRAEAGGQWQEVEQFSNRTFWQLWYGDQTYYLGRIIMHLLLLGLMWVLPNVVNYFCLTCQQFKKLKNYKKVPSEIRSNRCPHLYRDCIQSREDYFLKELQ